LVNSFTGTFRTKEFEAKRQELIKKVASFLYHDEKDQEGELGAQRGAMEIPIGQLVEGFPDFKKGQGKGGWA